MKRTFSHGLSLCTVALLLTSCADEEQEQLLLQLQNDMATANTSTDAIKHNATNNRGQSPAVKASRTVRQAPKITRSQSQQQTTRPNHPNSVSSCR